MKSAKHAVRRVNSRESGKAMRKMVAGPWEEFETCGVHNTITNPASTSLLQFPLTGNMLKEGHKRNGCIEIRVRLRNQQVNPSCFKHLHSWKESMKGVGSGN